jgi:PleD family two-component response regulator
MTPTPSQSAGTVLLIEDNEAVVDSIQRALGAADYKVVLANSAKTAFASIFKSPPDIIILDINLPDLDGFHVAQELKKNMMLRHIPVIVLSSRIDFLEKMRSLDVVVDEYIVKPIDPQDLLLRTRLVLQRAQVNLDANPLTKLPGNTAIVKTIKGKLAAGRPYAVGYADLNNFKAFNDRYGFLRGDQAIKLAAQCLVLSAEKGASLSSGMVGSWFIGHVGGDDFIIVLPADQAEDTCKEIISKFDSQVPNLYDEEDRQRGFILGKNRQGQPLQYPFIGMALVIVSNGDKRFTHPGEISSMASELKSFAKSFGKSAYVLDRRRNTADVLEGPVGIVPPPAAAAG